MPGCSDSRPPPALLSCHAPLNTPPIRRPMSGLPCSPAPLVFVHCRLRTKPTATSWTSCRHTIRSPKTMTKRTTRSGRVSRPADVLACVPAKCAATPVSHVGVPLPEGHAVLACTQLHHWCGSCGHSSACTCLPACALYRLRGSSRTRACPAAHEGSLASPATPCIRAQGSSNAPSRLHRARPLPARSRPRPCHPGHLLRHRERWFHIPA